jgi:hypothetical protein
MLSPLRRLGVGFDGAKGTADDDTADPRASIYEILVGTQDLCAGYARLLLDCNCIFGAEQKGECVM